MGVITKMIVRNDAVGYKIKTIKNFASLFQNIKTSFPENFL